MTKIFTPVFRIVIFFLLTTISVTRIQAQCNPPEQLPTVACENAPLICLEGACYETLGIPNPGPSGWCFGNNTIENAQYFQFIPTGPNVQINIHVDGCDSGTAL